MHIYFHIVCVSKEGFGTTVSLVRVYMLAFVLTLCIQEPLNEYFSVFANSEDPDEMQHNAAFHQYLQCL